MGLTCKPIGQFAGVMKKLNNQLEKEKAVRQRKSERKSSK